MVEVYVDGKLQFAPPNEEGTIAFWTPNDGQTHSITITWRADAD